TGHLVHGNGWDDLGAAVAAADHHTDRLDMTLDVVGNRPTAEMDHEADGANQLRVNRRRSHPGQGAERLEPGDDVSRTVGMDGPTPTLVAGVERRQELANLRPSSLTQDQSVGAHAQRLANQGGQGDLAGPLDVGWSRLQPDDLRLVDPEL